MSPIFVYILYILDSLASLDYENGFEIDLGATNLPQVSTLFELMDLHKESLEIDGFQKIRICRTDIWEDSVVVFKSREFKLLAKPKIVFAGGLSRE